MERHISHFGMFCNYACDECKWVWISWFLYGFALACPIKIQWNALPKILPVTQLNSIFHFFLRINFKIIWKQIHFKLYKNPIDTELIKVPSVFFPHNETTNEPLVKTSQKLFIPLQRWFQLNRVKETDFTLKNI